MRKNDGKYLMKKKGQKGIPKESIVFVKWEREETLIANGWVVNIMIWDIWYEKQK